jgi:hypothetical protein
VPRYLRRRTRAGTPSVIGPVNPLLQILLSNIGPPSIRGETCLYARRRAFGSSRRGLIHDPELLCEGGDISASQKWVRGLAAEGTQSSGRNQVEHRFWRDMQEFGGMHRVHEGETLDWGAHVDGAS